MRRWAICKTCHFGIVRKGGWRFLQWQHEAHTPMWTRWHKARPDPRRS